MGRVPTISLVRPTPCRDAVLPRDEALSGASRRPEGWSRLRGGTYAQSTLRPLGDGSAGCSAGSAATSRTRSDGRARSTGSGGMVSYGRAGRGGGRGGLGF